MPGAHPDAGGTQAMQPGTQQRRGLHVGREDASAGADEGRDAEALGPGADRRRVELAQPGRDLQPALRVTLDEGRERLAVREIQAAAAGEQELAAHRRHRVVDVDRDTRRRDDFRRHQPGRARADDAHCRARSLAVFCGHRRRGRVTEGEAGRKKYAAAATDAHPRSKAVAMQHPSSLRRARIAGIVVGLATLAHTASAAAGACMARSPRTATPVVELYTSEGCSSCPPADRWLSRLKADPDVVALAFHVDYWDRLGWKDRFASPLFTQRQAQQLQSNGARFSYTPQVVVDGADRTDWSRVALDPAHRSGAPAPIDLTLTRDGERVVAQVAASAGAPRRLAAYWAVTELGHVTAVKAGENDGATLKHDFVVRDYRPVAAWAARGEAPKSLVYDLPPGGEAAHPRQVNLVVVDADSGRPVQALKIGC